LTEEYCWWARHHPQLTAGMVRVIHNLEAAELQALRQYAEITAAKSEVVA
jgi:hypothetical protein